MKKHIDANRSTSVGCSPLYIQFFAMGVVENVLRKAKERTARANAKISGSNAAKFGRKIGIRSLLIKHVYIAILISSMGCIYILYIYICT